MTEGELWTLEVVAELRASRYGPRAWKRFVARSLARARLARHDHKRAHQQTLALAALGVAAWVAVALLGRPWLAVAGAAWWALVVLMLDWHLGMLEDARALGIPNLLSLARVAAVPALLVLPPTRLLVVLLVAGIADVLDGAIARAFGQATRLGAWLDGGVDGLVLGGAAIGAGLDGVLPWWAVALVVARHAVQWTVVAAVSLTASEPADVRRLVSGTIPGAVLFAGLALACLRLPGATAFVAAGSLGALATLLWAILRAVDSEDAPSPPGRSRARRRGRRLPAARSWRPHPRRRSGTLDATARTADPADRSAAGDGLRRDRRALPGPDAACAPARAGGVGTRHRHGAGRAPHAGA